MTRCVVVLALLWAAACTGCGFEREGIYRMMVPAQHYTAVAVGTNRLLSIVHPISVGRILWVWVRVEWRQAKVVAIGPQGSVLLEGVGQELDLTPGCSGSPIVADSCGPTGLPVALVVGHRAR